MAKWTMVGTRVRESEKQALEQAARDKGVTASALLYAILHSVTANFQQFDAVPDVMPRGFVVRNTTQKEVTE